MPTGQQIVNKVGTYLNVCDLGGTPGPSDSQAILDTLNTMWDRWGIDEGLIYAVSSNQWALSAYQQSYAIGAGAGADWSGARPARIYKAFVVNALALSNVTTTATSKTATLASTTGVAVGMGVMGTGIAAGTTIVAFTANTSITLSIAATASGTVNLTATGLSRNEVEIVESGQYYKHNDLGASAVTPEEIYPDYLPDTNGNMRIYLWPVVSEFQSSVLEIDSAVPFTTWTLGGTYQLPNGYQDAIEWAVAFRCLSLFGAAISSDVAQVVAAEGQKAEAAIREMNARNRQLPPPAVMTPASQVNPQPPGAGS